MKNKPLTMIKADEIASVAMSVLNTGKATAKVGALVDSMPEWKPDSGVQNANTYVKYEGVGYKCIAAIQRYSHWPPTAVPNNYTPLAPYVPLFDAYEYTPRMSVDVGMRVVTRNGIVYEAIQAITTMLNPPEQLPAIFKLVSKK